jgi:uncharacterized protein
MDELAGALTLRRHPERAVRERAEVEAILDEGLVCHVGIQHGGRPVVIPTAYARDGDVLYLHGSPLSRLLRTAGRGVDICVTVTLLDGLVLARAAFAHSMNFRSVMVMGRARPVSDEPGKLRAMRRLVEHVLPGRWEEVRQPAPAELAGTTILALALEHCSAKARSGPPVDSRGDRSLPVWAGELVLRRRAETAAAAPDLEPGIPLAESAAAALGLSRG